MYSATALRDAAWMGAYMLAPGVLSMLPVYPLEVAVERLQVNYAPLDAGERTPFKTVLGSLMHTYRAEGVRGLYKGMGWQWLGALFLISVPFINVLRFWADEADGREHTDVSSNVWFNAGVYLQSFAWIPLQVLTTRATVLPLSFTTGSWSPAALLTPAERANPFSLWSPSLIGMWAISTAVSLATTAITSRLNPHPDTVVPPFSWSVVFFKIALNVAYVPLITIEHRLRTYPFGATNGIQAQVPAQEKAIVGDSSTCRLRPSTYTSVLDAVRTIVREEGAGALFRGWMFAAVSTAVFELVPLATTYYLGPFDVPPPVDLAPPADKT